MLGLGLAFLAFRGFGHEGLAGWNPASMRFCILIDLVLLGLWSMAECTRVIPGGSSHVEVSNSNRYAIDSGGSRMARLDLELGKKSLMAFSLEEYGDLEAPPGLPEAKHGPVVFFRRKRRRILPPPGSDSQAEYKAHP